MKANIDPTNDNCQDTKEDSESHVYKNTVPYAFIITVEKYTGSLLHCQKIKY